MKNYRKIWEKTYGPIPEGYEIHHIDGNHDNNNIKNLLCVTTERHYQIHFEQGDYLACALMSDRLGLSPEEKKKIHKMAMEKRDQTGKKNPMYGRSAIKENNLRWYTNGSEDKMIVEGQEPEGWYIGRTNMPKPYDRSGSKNPRAKKVKIDGKVYSSILDAANELNVNHSSLKGALKRGYFKKYNMKIEYV